MYDPNWRQKALNEGKDQNSPEFAAMRAAEASYNAGGSTSSYSTPSASTSGYDPNWRQKALDIGDDQNSPKYAQMRAMEAQMGSGGGSTAGYTGLFNATPTIDLPKLYENLYAASGIKDLQAKKDEEARQAADVTSKINDNPWLSEATRVGRVAKVNALASDKERIRQNEIAQKQADVETKLNLEMKQFDIKSTAAQNALSQFNTLLASGALDNASGVDIANITRATGMPSNIIQSAIDASKQSRVKEVPTATISFDDGTNTGFAIINTQTGDIIKKQTVAASKPTAAETKAAAGGGGLSATQQRQVSAAAAKALTKEGKDDWVDLGEYKQALKEVVAATGVDSGTADNYLTQQMNALRLKKYKW